MSRLSKIQRRCEQERDMRKRLKALERVAKVMRAAPDMLHAIQSMASDSSDYEFIAIELEAMRSRFYKALNALDKKKKLVRKDKTK